ncbi:MAG: hypothetical protein KIT80_11605 [Chitinophagaceae bacterium]|nr:hypothetical protein [Chitinophagaceae bacterium]MCW5927548.1 hypothetical protein [Chitinophagaceae bacterium]
MVPGLQKQFYFLSGRYSDDDALIAACWNEIDNAYGSKKRYYHNLSHINSMIAELEKAKSSLENPDAILFSIFYHDIVYKVSRKDNEFKSALLAGQRLRQMNVPEQTVSRCFAHITATASHSKSEDPDTNYFTDADLSILGKPLPEYELYCRNIRKEYALFPWFLYKKGRKKVVEHFLQMPEIFKTPDFREEYEAAARENLRRELHQLDR